MNQAFNPYLPSYEYIPDGEPHLFGERIYLYGSHDRFRGAGFCLNDYVCYSASVDNLADWRYEGVIFRKEQDPRNQNIPADAPKQKLWYGVVPQGPEDLNPRGIHAMWAPDVVQGLDGKYYLYYCLDFLPEIGVAVCDTPAGSYEFLGFVRHKDGTPLGIREGDLHQFDPGIFIDDDKTIYLYSGSTPRNPKDKNPFMGSQVMTLEEDMLTLKSKPKKLMPDIRDAEKHGFDGHEFFEASSIRKINGLYYFVYSSVLCHELCYAISDKPDEGYQFGGILVDIGDISLEGRTEEQSLNPLGNTHGGIERAGDKWFIFYHRQTNRTNFSRQGCAEPIYFDKNGHISQAEVTSCGLNSGPLNGTGTYPARICCQLTSASGTVSSQPHVMTMEYPYLTQDCLDVIPSPETEELDRTHPIQYITNIQNGTAIGYKYFLFEQAKQIAVELRGEADGVIDIYTAKKGADPVREICDPASPVYGITPPLYHTGTIAVSFVSSDWQWICDTVAIPDGEAALYFVFRGSGNIHFRQFSIKSL